MIRGMLLFCIFSLYCWWHPPWHLTRTGPRIMEIPPAQPCLSSASSDVRNLNWCFLVVVFLILFAFSAKWYLLFYILYVLVDIGTAALRQVSANKRHDVLMLEYLQVLFRRSTISLLWAANSETRLQAFNWISPFHSSQCPKPRSDPYDRTCIILESKN